MTEMIEHQRAFLRSAKFFSVMAVWWWCMTWFGWISWGLAFTVSLICVVMVLSCLAWRRDIGNRIEQLRKAEYG